MKRKIYPLLLIMTILILVVIGIYINSMTTAHITAHYRKPVRLKTTVNSDWQLTVYYTAVDKYHNGPPVKIYGHRDRKFNGKLVYLGSFAQDFVNAVKTESSGLITTGPHAGEYLDYDAQLGFWLDTSPIGSRSNPLQPYVSMAADPSIPFGTHVKILDCGVDKDTGESVYSDTSNKIKSSYWVVVDRFACGKVGHHLDLYIGQEDRPDFKDNSPRSISTTGAKVMLSRP